MVSEISSFDLSPEQQDTALLLEQLLGQAIADRYVDFARLAAGTFALRVSRPMAAHAFRELESMLRDVLAVPMEAHVAVDRAEAERIDTASRDLRALGFDVAAIDRARSALRPRNAHKAQIRKIVGRLGLGEDGDIAKKWIALAESGGRAHERSHHRALAVDDEFRSDFQQPFDTVVRGVALALQGRYAVLMRRVEELAGSDDPAHAASVFAREIPGSLPLQSHFFARLETSKWLPHLAQEGLLGEPLTTSEEGAPTAGGRYRGWPAGIYLRRMAETKDAATRKGVIEALQKIGTSEDPVIQSVGVDILAALPADESAPLAELAVAWFQGAAQPAVLSAITLIRKLAEADQSGGCLRVAAAFLHVFEVNGEVASLLGRGMYEYHLAEITGVLTRGCGEPALRLLVDLLRKVAEINGRIEYGHLADGSVAADGMANHDPYYALISAVRRSAEMLVKDDATRMRDVIGILTRHPEKLFIRLALHVLAQNPSAAPDLAERLLLNPELIEANSDEYAGLARSWFPSLSADKQESLFGIIDAVPAKYCDAWRGRFEAHYQKPPTTQDQKAYEWLTSGELLWKWREVLPPARRDALNQIFAQRDDPDAWLHPLFGPDESPFTAADFVARPVSEITSYLKAWRPDREAPRRTVTALAQELCAAVGKDPIKYAAEAEQFADLKPIYVRRTLEGLRSAVSNGRDFEWANVLKLLQFTFAQHDCSLDSNTVSEGDDKDWRWACMATSELLAAGLRRGANGIAFEHDTLVHAFVAAAADLAPKYLVPEDFEERYRRDPYFAAQSTQRGITVELCILLIYWLSQNESTPIGASPREALANLPDIRRLLDEQLTDHSADGRIPRAIMGRYLKTLFYFGEAWLRRQLVELFPANDVQLRRATWLAHLAHDGGPIADFMQQLHDCYVAEIGHLADGDTNNEFRDYLQRQLAESVLILHLWDCVAAEDLLEQFWRNAGPELRRHAMWFVGVQVSRPSSDVPGLVKARCLAYWERRVAEAERATDKESFRPELGVISIWCSHGQVDELWLSDQLLRMLAAGFAPTEGFSVMGWLQKVASRHPNKAVVILNALLRSKHVRRLGYITHGASIRAILREGLAKGTPETIEGAQEAVSYLSSIGETAYLDLTRSTVGE